jgi:hypothetical protein
LRLAFEHAHGSWIAFVPPFGPPNETQSPGVRLVLGQVGG